MPNPGGNYPGRQIFVGGLRSGPAFAYFGSGRTPKSQQRYATAFHNAEQAVRIKPTDPDEPFDTFRHYQAVRINPETGLAVIVNNQAPVDPLFDAFSDLPFPEDFLGGLLGALGPEYDNPENPTPRIAAVMSCREKPRWVIGVAAEKGRGMQITGVPRAGEFVYVQTYDGNVNYRPFDVQDLTSYRTSFRTEAETAQGLADELYDISDYQDTLYGELRVWCVAGVRNGNGPGGWEIARRNRHSSPELVIRDAAENLLPSFRRSAEIDVRTAAHHLNRLINNQKAYAAPFSNINIVYNLSGAAMMHFAGLAEITNDGCKPTGAGLKLHTELSEAGYDFAMPER